MEFKFRKQRPRISPSTDWLPLPLVLGYRGRRHTGKMRFPQRDSQHCSRRGITISAIQETFQILTEIDKLLADIELKINVIEQKAPMMTNYLTTFKQVERLALRWLTLSRQLGLPDNIQGGIDKFMQLIVTVRMAQMSINMMMATNPATALIGIAGLIGTAATTTSFLEGY